MAAAARKLHGSIVIADRGLTASGRKMAELIANDHPDVAVCSPEDFPDLFEVTDGRKRIHSDRG